MFCGAPFLPKQQQLSPENVLGVMRRVPVLVALLAVSTSAIARGGRGSDGEATLMLALLAVFAVGSLGVWIDKNYPSFFPSLGGLALIFILSGFIAQVAAGLGLVSGWGALAVFAAAFLAILFGIPALLSRSRKK
jgi:hypothetical protein